jgi:hypothetical protein
MWVATGQLGLSGAGIGLVVTAVGWFTSARLVRHLELQHSRRAKELCPGCFAIAHEIEHVELLTA